MNNVIRLFLVSFVTLAFAGLGFAQPAPITPAPITPAPITPATPAGPEKKVERPKINRITGEVVSVDAKAGKLTVKAKDREASLVAETKALKSFLRKIKLGDRVGVSYVEKNGTLAVRSIIKTREEKRTMGAEKKSAKKAE